MRKTIQILFLLVVILSMLNCKTEKQKDQEIRTEVLSGRYDRARSLIREYYESDPQKILGWMLVIQKLEIDC